jgi:hypothetical protein
MHMLIEVKSIAFGMSRYSTRWQLDAAEAVKERDAAAAAIDTEVFAGVVPPPMQTQVQRMDGMSSAVIGEFCEHSPVVHELVAKFADMTAKDTAKEHGWQLKEATAYQRHRIRQRLATGRGMARLPRTQNRAPAPRGPQHSPSPNTHARFATSRPRTRGGEQRNTEHSRTPLGRREWTAQQGGTGTGPLAASPRPRSPGGAPTCVCYTCALCSRRGQRPHIDSTENGKKMHRRLGDYTPTPHHPPPPPHPGVEEPAGKFNRPEGAGECGAPSSTPFSGVSGVKTGLRPEAPCGAAV